MYLSVASAYLSAVKWKDEDCYLHDFTQKFTLPQVAKITKGQYLNLGVPTLSNPSLNQIVLLAHVGKRLKIAAQCVKFKDGCRVVPVGTKLSIPDNYEGWFEILSEDGKPVRCIESVGELLRRFPETCLVRENIKVYLAKTDNSEIISDKTKTVCAGESLVLVSEVHVTPAKSKSSGRYLRCFTTKGETIFLSADQKGKFSPVAREDSISGVHTVRNLLSKRFPLMVRLVHGKPPAGIKSNSHFVTEMRLYSLFEEESVIALPLLKDSQIVALPPSAPLKVQAPQNSETLMKLKNYNILVEKCNSLMQDLSDKIQIFDISLSKEVRAEKVQNKKGLKPFALTKRVQRSMSELNTKYEEKSKIVLGDKTAVIDYDEIDQIYDYVRGFAPLPQKTNVSKIDMNGNVNSSPNNSSTPSSSRITTVSTKSSDTVDNKPEPPPIETIPVKRITKDESKVLPERTMKIRSKTNDEFENDEVLEGHIYEKVEYRKEPNLDAEVSKTQEKLFISNNMSHGGRRFSTKSPAQQRIHHKYKLSKHSKSSPALKEVPLTKACQRQRATRNESLSVSPYFNIRYKSLINLSEDLDIFDTNISGGMNFFVSGGIKQKKPDRRTDRLQRPKSLTDLFGDVNRVCFHRNFECGMENRKLIFSHESANGKLLNGHPTKRISTLYL